MWFASKKSNQTSLAAWSLVKETRHCDRKTNKSKKQPQLQCNYDKRNLLFSLACLNSINSPNKPYCLFSIVSLYLFSFSNQKSISSLSNMKNCILNADLFAQTTIMQLYFLFIVFSFSVEHCKKMETWLGFFTIITIISLTTGYSEYNQIL